jgi:hypothetical protein
MTPNSHDRRDDERVAEPPDDQPDGADEELDEIGRESFPASDPPSSWAGPRRQVSAAEQGDLPRRDGR